MTKKTEPNTKASKGDGVLDGELVAMLNEMLSAEERDRILGQAEEQLIEIAGALRGAWDDGDARSAEREAHKLAGLAGTAGCVKVLGIARAIEAAAGNGGGDAVERHFAELDQAMPAALRALSDWRNGSRR
jgi:HPt (histidine-containing phosphotransfer) domain-containing protein